MTKPFDADVVLKYAKDQGIELLPWQRERIRAIAEGKTTHRARRAGTSTIRTLIEAATNNHPALPTTIDYHHVITLLTALLPGLDPTLVSWVNIKHDVVRVEYWDGTKPAMHVARITHVQGSATEGGHPTTPPTGLTNIDGSDTQ